MCVGKTDVQAVYILYCKGEICIKLHANLAILNIYEIFTIFGKSFCKFCRYFTSFGQHSTMTYVLFVAPFLCEELEHRN